MKPFVVLLTVFGLTLLGTKVFYDDWFFVFAGNLAMSVMLVFTAFGHFAFFRGMERMLPPFIPFKKWIIFLTGIVEIVAAAGLLIISTRHITAIFLIIFFTLILPANIYAAIHKIDYQNANSEGSGPAYLWFRIPLQIFFIIWVAWFAL